uniref:Uncharacterized protein n=1 Tax=Arundo donax TaxID=35708 RepID=A0A0A9B656_ARUDO
MPRSACNTVITSAQQRHSAVACSHSATAERIRIPSNDVASFFGHRCRGDFPLTREPSASVGSHFFNQKVIDVEVYFGISFHFMRETW